MDVNLSSATLTVAGDQVDDKAVADAVDEDGYTVVR